MKRINIAGLALLTVGIAIGIALTMISMHAVGVTPGMQTATNGQPKLLAEKSPPGAADAQTQQPEQAAAPAAEQVAEETPAEPQAPANWLKPEDVAAQNGTAPPAAPKYQSSHTEYYIYPTGGSGPVSYPTNMATPESGFAAVNNSPVMIGENGLIQNPCVDPPSVRGRAYRH